MLTMKSSCKRNRVCLRCWTWSWRFFPKLTRSEVWKTAFHTTVDFILQILKSEVWSVFPEIQTLTFYRQPWWSLSFPLIFWWFLLHQTAVWPNRRKGTGQPDHPHNLSPLWRAVSPSASGQTWPCGPPRRRGYRGQSPADGQGSTHPSLESETQYVPTTVESAALTTLATARPSHDRRKLVR